MSKVKVHIDSQDPSPQVVKKYKNYSKVGGKITRYQTFGGLTRAFYKDRRFRTMLILLWLLVLLFMLSEIFEK